MGCDTVRTRRRPGLSNNARDETCAFHTACPLCFSTTRAHLSDEENKTTFVPAHYRDVAMWLDLRLTDRRPVRYGSIPIGKPSGVFVVFPKRFTVLWDVRLFSQMFRTIIWECLRKISQRSTHSCPKSSRGGGQCGELFVACVLSL